STSFTTTTSPNSSPPPSLQAQPNQFVSFCVANTYIKAAHPSLSPGLRTQLIWPVPASRWLLLITKTSW
ncbi:hypothetical protein PCANC_24264, partial [Puccinia coronata f. sp. avenae]